MSHITLITGGARSGKSSFAEQLALPHGAPRCYLATARAWDGEMRERIERHRERRDSDWQTVEEPLQLASALTRLDGGCHVILVDCVTLWLTNLLLAREQEPDAEERILAMVRDLAEQVRRMATPVILVTNEVGSGIVPENRLARLFRDLAGRANQLLAAAADEVHVVISGIPLKLK